MAIKAKILVRKNAITGSLVASANIVDLQEMSFDEFCEYLSQDSTVGSADVAAVMKQLEKKLPLILGMGTRVQISAEGMTVRPTVSGSLSQEDLKARLEARKAALLDAGDTESASKVDVERQLSSSDLKVDELQAGISVQFSKKFVRSFGETAKFVRVKGVQDEEVEDTPVEGSKPSGGSGNESGGTNNSGGEGAEIS